MRSKSANICAVALLLVTASCASTQSVPVWVKVLHWISGDSSATTVPIMMMDDQMQMSRPAAPKPGDAARADSIVTAARAVLTRYPDVASAQRDGYKLFHETGALGEEVHYTSIGYSGAEGRHIDYAHPGSILFVRTREGLQSVGVMYGAPSAADASDLDARAPLSKATWHRHVDFCFPTGKDQASEMNGPRFGYSGSLHDKASCEGANGYWLPLAFGWMTHVYPGRTRPWGGEHMAPGDATHVHEE